MGLPRNLDPADEAALVEQGMTPGMRFWSAPAAYQALKAGALPINPEPQEGELYWIWCRDAQEHWQPARFVFGHWTVVGHGIPWGRAGVKFWRGPLVPPEAPTPAQVEAVLGRRPVVHDAADLEATG